MIAPPGVATNMRACADEIERARRKLVDKGLDLLAVNRADEPGAGAEVETNKVTLLTGAAERALPLMSKRDVAEAILDAVEELR